jgi:twitching motility protein PilT
MRAATALGADSAPDMTIERGQYESGPVAIAVTATTTSGSLLLDQLTTAARAARATDVYLACGAAPMQRVGGVLSDLGDHGPLDAETLSRELGIVAPAGARAVWSEIGSVTFAYGDGVGRVRASLSRDHRGPGAALRLLVAEPPALDRLGLGETAAWLDTSGLVLVGGPSGSGKTTTLAALVRGLGERSRRVIAIEDPIEIVHATSPFVSQRAVGEHAASIAGGVAAAMRENADAIVVGAVTSAEAAEAVLDAVAAGHLVLATIASPGAATALELLVGRVAADRRGPGIAAIAGRHLGSLAVRGRAFEIVAGDRAQRG